MNSKSNITAFHGIFEQRFKKLIKDIKKVKREQPEAKGKLKSLLSEARELRKVIKKTGKVVHRIEIPVTSSDKIELAGITSPTENINVLDTRIVGGLLIVEFEFHS